MEELIEKLNKTYSIQRPLSFDNNFWTEFEQLILLIKQKGISFKHLSYDASTFEKVKSKGNQDAVDTIEVLTYKIEQCENNLQKDNILSGSDKDKNFVLFYLRNLKRERDVWFSDLINEQEFKRIDERTIQFASCINEIYDYKIKHIINN